jgi:DNA-directed RNA polymerase subunit RPC12/RpoP
MATTQLDPCKRYPVQYYCTHCGNRGYTAKDGKPSGKGWLTCPTCRFGALAKMTWNGMAWH